MRLLCLQLAPPRNSFHPVMHIFRFHIRCNVSILALGGTQNRTYENSLVHTEPKEFTLHHDLYCYMLLYMWAGAWIGECWMLYDNNSLVHTEPKDFIAWSLLLSMGWLQVAVHVCDLPILILKIGGMWLATSRHWSLISLRSAYYVNCPAT